MTRNANHFVFAGQDTTQNKMFVRVLTECDSSLASNVSTERILTHEEKKKKKK